VVFSTGVGCQLRGRLATCAACGLRCVTDGGFDWTNDFCGFQNSFYCELLRSQVSDTIDFGRTIGPIRFGTAGCVCH